MSTSADHPHNLQREQTIRYYQRVIRKMPEFTSFSINAHLKLGRLYAEMGQKDAAIQEYSTAAAQYLHNGALVKAIAANKMIIELAPEREDILAELRALYFQHGEFTEYFGVPKDVDHQVLGAQLANIPLFSYLAEKERLKIAEFLSPVQMQQGTLIIKEGEIGDCMYLIQSGKVEVYTMLIEDEQHQDESEQEPLHLATLQAGDFFGEQALITNDPRNATIIALTDVCLLRFSKPDLAAVVKSYPRVGELIERYHHQRNTQTIVSLKAVIKSV